MATADEVIEIRPIRPRGRVWPAATSMLRIWRLRADPHDGTLQLTEDRSLYRQPIEHVFALPSTGRADAVTTTCLATFNYSPNFPAPRTFVCRRVLFLDRDDHVVGTGQARDEPQASEIWPVESFAPLAKVGIRITTERYSSPQSLERAYPGAAPKFMLRTWRIKALIGIVGTLALLLIVGTSVYLATH
jgi:hypothetical protein